MSGGNPIVGYGSGAYGNAPIETLDVGYYLSLLIWQYRNTPNFLTFLTAMLQKLDDVSQCLVAMDSAFDLDNAIGVQLDAVGTLVDVTRTVGFQPSGGVSPILDDATFRIYIKAVAAKNSWDGKIDSLQAIWAVLFPGGTIVIGDVENMSVTIFLIGTFTSIVKDMIVNGYIVPRPQGVLYNYEFGPFPLFGFDGLNPTYIAGFDLGHFA